MNAALGFRLAADFFLADFFAAFFFAIVVSPLSDAGISFDPDLSCRCPAAVT
jgi:hypothetical protein